MNRLIKGLCNLLLTMVIITTSFAQVPQKVSYQAIIRDSGNHLATDTETGLRISIIQGSADGLPVYVETHNPVTDGSGRISIIIGSGTTSDALSSIDWSAGPYFIKTETAPSGGTDYTITGTSQLLIVPYAFYATRSETADYNSLLNLPELFDGNYGSLTEKPFIPADISELTYNAGLFFDGNYFSVANIPDIKDSIILYRFDGDYNSLGNKPRIINDFEMDANSLNINNLADPVNPKDAVTKKYVDMVMEELSTLIKALEEK